MKKQKYNIIYVGDPMCSWCWGISPALIQLRDHFVPLGIDFKIVVGGLRPGGGDPWDDKMKEFLKHHWHEVHTRSGQPFSYKLFDQDSFNYDTEPACRAVIAARPLVGDMEMEFFEEIQRQFYAYSNDPGELSFYQIICEKFNISFEEFSRRFLSDEVKQETKAEFIINRQWGIQGYPSVLLHHDQELQMIAYGYSEFEVMRDRVEQILEPDLK